MPRPQIIVCWLADSSSIDSQPPLGRGGAINQRWEPMSSCHATHRVKRMVSGLWPRAKVLDLNDG